jgi:hypothetical protein
VQVSIPDTPYVFYVSPVGELRFNSIIEPKRDSSALSPRYTYSACLVFGEEYGTDMEEHRQFAAEIKAVLKNQWPDGYNSDYTLRTPLDRFSIYHDNEPCFRASYSTSSLNSVSKPAVTDIDGTLITLPHEVWPGQLARLSVDLEPFVLEPPKRYGVKATLRSVQIVDRTRKLDVKKAASRFRYIEDFKLFSEKAPAPCYLTP